MSSETGFDYRIFMAWYGMQSSIIGAMDRYVYKGVVHMHSTYSDGNDTVEDVMDAASECGLDFVVLTDHDTLQPRHDGLERWYGTTLLLAGCEITPRHNHYITFGEGEVTNLSQLKNLSPKEYVKGLSMRHWAGFIAHPFYHGSQKLGTEDYSWIDWNVTDYTGMSVWHLVDSWLAALDSAPALDLSLYEKFEEVVKAPRPEAIRKWDELLKLRKVVAIAEIDNHSSKKKFNGQDIVIFPLKKALKTLTNNVILDQPLSSKVDAAKRQIIAAFKKGNSFISNDAVGDSSDFYFNMEVSGRLLYPGDEVRFASGEIVVSLPEDATIKVIRNGELYKQTESFELVEPLTEKGCYRTEVYKSDRCWLLTNPIYIL